MIFFALLLDLWRQNRKIYENQEDSYASFPILIGGLSDCAGTAVHDG